MLSSKDAILKTCMWLVFTTCQKISHEWDFYCVVPNNDGRNTEVYAMANLN